ncbi:MAG: RCC1-like domain-containing protein [bacterium]
MPEKVVKVVSGYRHNLAMTEKGNVYGWGYNNQ